MKNEFCSVQDCRNPVLCLGYCAKHYARFYRYGTTELQTPPPIVRFWNQIDLHGKIWNGSHCWEWIGNKNSKGYGRFSVNHELVVPHRFSYETFFGKIPDGLQIDHLCRNHSCCNPCHLEPVTQSVNLKRGNHATPVNDIGQIGHDYQTAKTHCPKGHPYTPENTWIDKDGYRSCRKCHADRQNARYHNSRNLG